MSSDDNNNTCDKVVPFTHREAKQILDKLSDLDNKFTTIQSSLSKLDVIDERIQHLNTLHVDLKKRVEDLEKRERDKERDFQFAVSQAREFKELKPQIANNTTYTSLGKSIINWVGVIAAAIVTAAILTDREPTKFIYRDELKSKKEAIEVIENGS